ncbi:MAG TPA: DUF2252 domain-containing protein [Terriglobales bacterium]|nr:DUF2252 domain-containing protein [Terriglobales bacterium]
MIAPDRGLQERLLFGRNLRKELKRTDQSRWDKGKRKNDPIEIILDVNRQRIPQLVPIKMARMALSPFSFFRGSVPVMGADLATLPRTGIPVQICGDAHVRNLGAYSGPDGRLIFDINDFDETIRAPWEWDLKRLAASLVLAGREAGNSEHQCRDAVMTCARIYRTKMAEFSRMTCLEVHKYRIHRQFSGKTGVSVLQRAERATPEHTLAKLTVRRGAKRVLREVKPVLTHPSKSTAKQVLQSIKPYRETLSGCSQAALDFYRPVDVAFKIVGTGSVATHDYVVLHFAGEDARDPLFLQIKEALQSAYAPYVKSPETVMHQGQRVVHGQRMLQVQSDIMLGWTSIAGGDYMVRQLSDHKASISNEDLKGVGLIEYATTCGEVLAKGHARSGDPAVLAGYLGGSDRWDKALAKFAFAYADQTTQDYEKFAAAIRCGRIKADKPCL